MDVILTQQTRWEINEEKIFVLYEDEWEEFQIKNGHTENSRKNFLLSILWQIVPYFEEVGGVETWDNAEIDLFFKEGTNHYSHLFKKGES